MYSPVREAVKAIFKVSPDPPHLPPGHGEAQVFRASRSYWRYRMLGYGIGMIFLLLLFGGPSLALLLASWQGSGLNWGPHEGIIVKIIVTVLMGTYALIGAVWYAIVRLDYEFRWYIVTDRSLRIRQGIMTFEETTLTFANVQNAEIQQGPIERAFGFANVLVETAGGGGPPVKGQAGNAGWHKGLIRGLDDASRVRDLIRAAMARHGGAGLGDKDDAARAPARASVPVALAALSPALREVLDETVALRAALQGRGGPPTGGAP